jgi:hypothetical protein
VGGDELSASRSGSFTPVENNLYLIRYIQLCIRPFRCVLYVRYQN